MLPLLLLLVPLISVTCHTIESDHDSNHEQADLPPIPVHNHSKEVHTQNVEQKQHIEELEKIYQRLLNEYKQLESTKEPSTDLVTVDDDDFDLEDLEENGRRDEGDKKESDKGTGDGDDGKREEGKHDDDDDD